MSSELYGGQDPGALGPPPDPWDEFFDVTHDITRKVDAVIGEALKGYPRPFKVAVWSAIIEAFAERMRLDIDLPDLPPRTEATP